MRTDFDDLQQITAILEERALAHHRDVLTRERALRRELDEIEALRHATLRQDADAHDRRMLGADGLWQGWLAQRRLSLNQEFALLQVRKSESRSAAQTALARHEATTGLVMESCAQHRRRTLARDERRCEEGALAASWPTEQS